MKPESDTSQHSNHRSAPFRKSLGFAWSGVCRTLRQERNMKIHFGFATGVLLFDLIVRPHILLVTLTVLAIAMVIAIELVNTAAERVTDLATGGTRHELAKLAKDSAAGAVLIASLGAMAIGWYVCSATYPWKWALLSTTEWQGAVLSGLALAVVMGAVATSVRMGQKR